MATISASPASNGATVDFVWDVFTPDKQRAQRLTDTIVDRYGTHVLKVKKPIALQVFSGEPRILQVEIQGRETMAARKDLMLGAPRSAAGRQGRETG